MKNAYLIKTEVKFIVLAEDEDDAREQVNSMIPEFMDYEDFTVKGAQFK